MWLLHEISLSKKRKNKFNILFLYDAKYIYINTIREYLQSFKIYSTHNIYYFPGTSDFDKLLDVDFSAFDVIMIHYSVRLYLYHGTCTFSESTRKRLRQYNGYKVLFIQDEYDHTNITKEQIKYLGINLVYTCVPRQYIDRIYPSAEFPNTEFIPVLTGYISKELKKYRAPPLHLRKLDICYRGNNLPYWYGDLGQEKALIGIKVKEAAIASGLRVDIEWEPTAKIFRHEWYSFLASSKVTLGTESGSNLFDFDGKVRENISAYLSSINPHASYEEIREPLIEPHDNFIKMNQISPKIFESICLGTVLILFEGDYSNILVPNHHYIPLKKDFSNIDYVLSKVQDVVYLKKIAEQAYTDIVKSNTYSYENYVKSIDTQINQRAIKLFKNKKNINPNFVFENGFSSYAKFVLSDTYIKNKFSKNRHDLIKNKLICIANKAFNYIISIFNFFKTQLPRNIKNFFNLRRQLSPGGYIYKFAIMLNYFIPSFLPFLIYLKRIYVQNRNVENSKKRIN